VLLKANLTHEVIDVFISKLMAPEALTCIYDCRSTLFLEF